MSALRIFLVDDHPVLCQGITLLLQGAGLTVCATAASLPDALRLLPEAQPDVVLVDLTLGPAGDGLALLAALAQSASPARRLVYSMREDAASIHRSLAAGALGYVTKAEVWETLVTAIQAVARGERFLSPRARRALNEPAEERRDELPAKISARERAVFDLLAEGFRIAEIASRLEVSPRTVESYCGRLLVKLNLPGMRELRRQAIGTRR
ncbi:MAG TPA: response regulator transcription factor [Polyangia bacterium]|jgi:DNA-binding NarL/FixJ family response regulator